MSEIKNVSWPGWDVVGIIGRGSFGTVYKIQREVYGDLEEGALKVIVIPRSEDEVDYLRCSGLDDQSITQTFHQQVGDIAREYKLMTQMRDNPNIVHCDDFRDIQHDDGLGWDIYIKMELLTPLMKALDQVTTEEQIIGLGKDLCNALVTCQEKNIIHRDIKPQNVFVSKSGQFKLGDFGIARTVERTTRATAGIGTYSYMAPEVEKNEPYGKSADIYSLGLLMYWLLNERRGPFMPLPPAVPKYGDEEKARNRRFAGEAIPAPKNGSDALKAIVLKACAYDPKERYQTAGEMLEALRSVSYRKESLEGIEDEKSTDEKKHRNKELEEKECIARDQECLRRDQEEKESLRKKEPQQKKSSRKKMEMIIGISITILFAIIVICYLTIHSWTNATCAEHSWTNATCAEAKRCSICGRTEGMSLGHSWIDATCKEPKKCSVCGRTEGASLSHSWIDATCTEAKKCSICGGTRGMPLGHRWIMATYEAPRTCAVCGETYGDVLVNRRIICASAGWWHVALLKADGTVTVKGHTDVENYGQYDTEEWDHIVSISAGNFHTVGLKADGTVVATGRNDEGQCEVSSWYDIIAISAGDVHTVGLRADGTVVAVGSKSGYMYCDGGQGDVSEWTDIIEISAGSRFTVGLKADGTVVAVGGNDYGQCDVSSWEDIAHIDAGYIHTVGLKADGTVVAAGPEGRLSGFDVSDWKNIISISVGNEVALGLKNDGTVVYANSNSNKSYEYLKEWSDIVAIEAGQNDLIGITSDGWFCSKRFQLN